MGKAAESSLKSAAALGRNLGITAVLVAALVVGVVGLTSTLLLCGLAVFLGLAGIVLLRGNGWRSGALVVSALAVGLALLDLMALWLWPRPVAEGVVYTPEFATWAGADPVLGYRLRPGITVRALATMGDETIYRATYTIGADGWRITPNGPPQAPVFLFIGGSCIFGQGVDDDQTLPAQFAKANDFKVRTSNLSVPGYGANHMARAFEAGLFDRYANEPVKAVVTWITSMDLARVSGDEPWLENAPRYELEDRALRYTGTFLEHRWRNPLDFLAYQARERFAFARAIGLRRRQERQADLFVAMIARLRAEARERFGAPLVVVHQLPDQALPPDGSEGRE
ncbi:MAG: hypothetical protein AB7F22_35380, partial [Reyranella sp.]|uniref:hypothetical protein n=1 Tax=Reyranella sp. TaxID=1929291 RepID=UPI003D0B5ABE